MMSWKELLNLLESELSNYLKEKKRFINFLLHYCISCRRWASELKDFQNYRLKKLKKLKKPLNDSVSRQPSAGDVLTGLTHC